MRFALLHPCFSTCTLSYLTYKLRQKLPSLTFMRCACPLLHCVLQFHPEFKSRPGRASPLFLGFILASGKPRV
jgi:hypothetical protein